MKNIQVFRSDNANSKFIDSSRRVDANELMFFTNELTTYDPKQFEVIKAPLTGFKVFQTKEVERYSTVYSYSMFEGFGKSKYSASATGKNKDTPFVGVGGKQQQSPLEDIICAMAFSDADILASDATRRDIIGTLKRQALRSNFELMNATMFYGYKELGLPSLYLNPFFTPPNPSSSTIDLKDPATTPLQMLKVLTDMYIAIVTATNNVIVPDTMLIAPALYNIINVTIFNTFNGTTVKQQFEEAQQVQIIVCPELSASSLAHGIGGTQKDSIILFANDQDYIQHIVANLFSVRPPQQVGLDHIVYCESKHGGLIIRQPAAFTKFVNKS